MGMNMEIAKSNENGVFEPYLRFVVASYGLYYADYADVRIAFCEDSLYRCAVGLLYSYGGFSGPVFEDGEAYPTFQKAKEAGLQQLLRRWHKAWPTEPQSVHDELNDMRRQIEEQLRQPSLF